MKKLLLSLAAVVVLVATACVPGNNTLTAVGPGTDLPHGWYLITHESNTANCTLSVYAPDDLDGFIGINQPNVTAVLIEFPINYLRLNNNCSAQFRTTEPPASVVIRAISYLI